MISRIIIALACALALSNVSAQKGTSPDEFGKYLRSEIDRYARLVKTAGLKPE